MPTFRYVSSGAAVGGASGSAPEGAGGGAGVIEAPDRASAVRALMGRGIVPTRVEIDAGSVGPGGAPAALAREERRPGAGASRARPRGRIGLGDTAAFVRELATAVQAGLPMVPALRTLAKSKRSPIEQAMLAHLMREVEQGKTLAEAARSWGKPFGELLVSLIKAGESSGRLGDTLYQAADLLERDLNLRRAIMSATLYPAILTALVSIAVVVVTTVIVPKVLEPLKGQMTRLPVPTQIVQGAANFFAGYWWLLVILAALGVVTWQRLRAAPSSRAAIDRFVLGVPVLGPLVRDAAVARFTRTLGTLVRSGLPVLTALRLTGETLTNLAMRAAVMRVCDQVAGGRTIAEPLEATGMFPPLLVQIVSLGERSGKLPELLGQAAGALDERTQTRVKIFTTVLPPILIVVLACVVGLVVASIILPLLDMQEAMQRG